VLEDLSFEGRDNLFLMICYDVACSYFELGDYRNAELFCKKALQVDPHYIDVLFTLGVVRTKMCQWTKATIALRGYLQALDEWRASPKLHQLSLGSIDHEFLAYALLGECFLRMGAVPQALESFERALVLYEENRRSWPAEVCPHPDILLQLGNAAVRLQRFAQALDFFQQCLHLGASSPQLFNNLAGCYARLGEFARARAAYEQALRLNPHYEDALSNLQALERLSAARCSKLRAPATA
jgi:tetratricopeptide (TPR) repeat protein